MEEAKRREAAAAHDQLTAVGAESLGGRVQVRWNKHEAAAPFGQKACFAAFLDLIGLCRRRTENSPLRYASPHGSKIADVLGTLFCRCFGADGATPRIVALRADTVSASVLGMNAAVSGDTVRQALRGMDESGGDDLSAGSSVRERVAAAVCAVAKRATKAMEKHCGAVARDDGTAAGLRVHRDLCHRFD